MIRLFIACPAAAISEVNAALTKLVTGHATHSDLFSSASWRSGQNTYALASHEVDEDTFSVLQATSEIGVHRLKVWLIGGEGAPPFAEPNSVVVLGGLSSAFALSILGLDPVL